MGTFSIRVAFEGLAGRAGVDALVEAGASYAILPTSVLRSIGVEPDDRGVGFRKRSETAADEANGPLVRVLDWMPSLRPA